MTGSSRNCQTFPGNIIPTHRIDPTSQQLLEFYPAPNQAPSGGFNYLSEQNRTIDRKQYTQRMICTGGDSPAADKGRAYTKRTDPW